MPTASEPFLLVRFLCGFPKKMNTAVGPRHDDLKCLYPINQYYNRRVASRHTPYFLSMRQQKVSKKCLSPAACMSACGGFRSLIWLQNKLLRSVFDSAKASMCLDCHFIATCRAFQRRQLQLKPNTIQHAMWAETQRDLNLLWWG